MTKKGMTALAVIILLAASMAGAQESEDRPMREEIIKLNYVGVREAHVQSLLIPFISREGRMHFSESQNMISLRDYPENVEKILAFIKKIDVKPADLLFTVQLILASSGDDIRTDAALAEDAVIKELKSFLKYRNFALLDTSLVRALDRHRSSLILGSKEAEFRLQIVPEHIRDAEGDVLRLQVELDQRIPSPTKEGVAPGVMGKTLIESHLSLKPGEKTVVGVSKMDGGDKGLILIISGKIV